VFIVIKRFVENQVRSENLSFHKILVLCDFFWAL